MNFEAAAEYLHGLTRFGIKLGNERFEALLARLGDPHRGLRAVHVAGTKGKGSTAVMAASILRAAGHRVGTYLSPYVYDLRERVQADGEMIPRGDFARLATEIRAASEALAAERPELGPVTEFEFKTAVGFRYFAEQAVDYAVVEVGLGGRLDATNVLPAPLVSVITNIGYDHTHILGDTLALIAGEKAGIVKPGGSCVTGADAPEALERIAAACRERHASLAVIAEGHDWGVDERAGGLWLRTPLRHLRGVAVGLPGAFQAANAALAAHALDRTLEPIPGLTDDAVRAGLAAARLPGRMETARAESPAVLLDAAHNGMAGAALSEALRRWLGGAGAASVARGSADAPVFVVGLSAMHEPEEFLRALLRGFDLDRVAVVATEPPFRPRPLSDVAGAARALGARRVESVAGVPEAARCGVSLAPAGGLVVVTGSFYTVGALPPGPERDALLTPPGSAR